MSPPAPRTEDAVQHHRAGEQGAAPTSRLGEAPRSKREAARPYVLTWVALMLLLAATTASAFVPLGAFNTVLNLGIALLKALLVAWFFMHLTHASALTRTFAVSAVFMLALLFALTWSDYATRPVAPAPWWAPR